MASDASAVSVGWHVDDVTITGAASDIAIGISSASATSIPWTVPTAWGDDYCVRIQGQAAEHSDPPLVTSGTFTVGDGAGAIFSDGFESGDTTLWTVFGGGVDHAKLGMSSWAFVDANRRL